MDVPKAPGLGLVLDKVHYERYDKWYEKTHEKLNNWGDEIEARADEFRQRYIIEEICRQELSTQSSVFIFEFKNVRISVGFKFRLTSEESYQRSGFFFREIVEM